MRTGGTRRAPLIILQVSPGERVRRRQSRRCYAPRISSGARDDEEDEVGLKNRVTSRRRILFDYPPEISIGPRARFTRARKPI